MNEKKMKKEKSVKQKKIISGTEKKWELENEVERLLSCLRALECKMSDVTTFYAENETATIRDNCNLAFNYALLDGLWDANDELEGSLSDFFEDRGLNFIGQKSRKLWGDIKQVVDVLKKKGRFGSKLKTRQIFEDREKREVVLRELARMGSAIIDSFARLDYRLQARIMPKILSNDTISSLNRKLIDNPEILHFVSANFNYKEIPVTNGGKIDWDTIVYRFKTHVDKKLGANSTEKYIDKVFLPLRINKNVAALRQLLENSESTLSLRNQSLYLDNSIEIATIQLSKGKVETSELGREVTDKLMDLFTDICDGLA